MTLLTKQQRDLVVNLHIADQERNGHPALRPDEVLLARALLHEMLPDHEKLEEYVQLLAELYRARFRPPTPRGARWEGEPLPPLQQGGFRHCELLAEERVNAIADRGPEALTDDEVARLLLDPFALYDLADLIRTFLPEWWIEPLAAAGRDIVRRHDLVIRLPETEKKRRRSRGLVKLRSREPRLQGRGHLEQRGDSLVIGFAADSLPLKRRIAEMLYGEPRWDFTLTLHRRQAGEGGACIVELEVSPAPLKADLTLTVEIKGHARTFTLAVPPSVRLDPEADVPDSAFARAAEPVPAEAFNLKGGAEWSDNAWPPHLVLRCRRGLITTGGR